jgi:hypothetical protein
MAKSGAEDSVLTGISVAYSDQVSHPKVRMTKKARKKARGRLKNDGEPIKPFGMSSSRKRITPSDPAQNNPNDIGAKIIPQGTGPM